jgi:ribosomal-protein-alanine N-acetyltransferase
MHLNTRLLHKDDLLALAEIAAQVQPNSWTLNVLQDCLKPGYIIWVVEDNNYIIGFLVARLLEPEIELMHIAVDLKARRLGVGRHLVQYLISYAAQHVFSRVFLEVRKSNTAAVQLYRQLGFKLIGYRKAYYPTVAGREDAAVYALLVT